MGFQATQLEGTWQFSCSLLITLFIQIAALGGCFVNSDQLNNAFQLIMVLQTVFRDHCKSSVSWKCIVYVMQLHTAALDKNCYSLDSIQFFCCKSICIPITSCGFTSKDNLGVLWECRVVKFCVPKCIHLPMKVQSISYFSKRLHCPEYLPLWLPVLPA